MWIWIALLAIGAFVIAAASIGSVTGTLAEKPRRSVYDLAEATQFVAEPAAVQYRSLDVLASLR